MFALVDCNSFYASCEKLFRPDLRDTPVVVLSNNDGCIVARSAEAKALGIKMGVPYFKAKDFCKQNGVAVFSSNYTLYQDLSNRVMTTLENLAPDVEIYSIDEAFLQLEGFHEAQQNLVKYAAKVKNRIYRDVGIPVGVGIAPTKTLAKLANHHAKKQMGVCVIEKPEHLEYYLKNTHVSDVWGVGRQLTQRLDKLGIHTAYELAYANKKEVRKHYSVMLERTARELTGEVCYELDPPLVQKKEIVSSRSFSKRITDKTEMHEAIAKHVTRACEKLRQQDSVAKGISVFFRTGMFNEREKRIKRRISASLVLASSDTRDYLRIARDAVDKLWLDDYRYAKAGVMLYSISPERPEQLDIFSTFDEAASEKSAALMNALDNVNQRYGKHTAIFAAEGINKSWAMSRDMLSPAYTTNLNQLWKIP